MRQPAAILPSTPFAFPTPQLPPRRVLLPRLVSSATMARSLVWPAARMAAMTGGEVAGESVGVGGDGGAEGGAAFSGAAEACRTVGVAEADAARPGRCEGLLCPARDRLALCLRVPRDDGRPFQLIMGSDSTG
jgi:hypothetical protein